MMRVAGVVPRLGLEPSMLQGLFAARCCGHG